MLQVVNRPCRCYDANANKSLIICRFVKLRVFFCRKRQHDGIHNEEGLLRLHRIRSKKRIRYEHCPGRQKVFIHSLDLLFPIVLCFVAVARDAAFQMHVHDCSLALQVCANDEGGTWKQNVWTSFLRTKLVCQLDGGSKSFTFDEATGITFTSDGIIYGTFTSRVGAAC